MRALASRLPARHEPAQISPALIGRAEELAAVVSVLAAPPSIAVVEGEAGVGKSRLVSEVLASSDTPGHIHLVGCSGRSLDPFPFGAVVEALRTVGTGLPPDMNPIAGALRPLLPELSHGLPPALEPLADPHAERHRLFRAVAALLEHLAPVTLVIEDVHWADSSTVALLSYLCAHPPMGTAVVLTWRREELADSSPLLPLIPPGARLDGSTRSVRLELNPLSVAEVGAFAGAMLGQDQVSEEFARYLHDRTGGIPFAVEELVHLLRDRRDIVQEDGQWVRRVIDELHVPAALGESIRARLGRLPPAARDMLQAAAVLSRPSDEGTLATVAHLDASSAAPALAAAVTSGLLNAANNTYRFRHVLAREAIYEGLEPPIRRALHDRAATVLASLDGRPADIAEHCREAGRLDEWVVWTEKAGDLAVEAGNDAVAAELLLRALRDPALPANARGRIAAKAGYAAVMGGTHAEAVASIERSLNQDRPPASLRGELRFVLGRLLLRSGQPLAAREQFLHSVEDLRDRPGLQARAMASVAFAADVAGGPMTDGPWLEEATKVAATVDDRLVRMVVAVDRAAILLNRGDPAGRDALAAVPACGPSHEERFQRLRLCVNAAYGSIRMGHYSLAARMVDEVLADGEQSPLLRDMAAVNALLLDWYRGDWQGLRERVRAHADSVWTEGATDDEEQLILACLSLVNHDADCRRVLEDVVTDAVAARQVHAAAAAGGGLIRLVLSGGDVEEAVRWSTLVADLVAAEGSWVSFSECGVAVLTALQEAGRVDDANAWLQRAGATLATRDAPAAAAALEHCNGLVAWREQDFDLAHTRLDTAAAAWRALPRPYDAIQVEEHTGMLLLEAGRPTGSEVLVQSLERYGELGSTWDASRLRRVLRDAGISAPAWRRRKGYGNRLSPREAEVARLAALGKTNKEIGRELFLSPRTVGDHVSHAMRKLGIDSRRALSAHLDD